jgi:hypothetical protein
MDCGASSVSKLLGVVNIAVDSSNCTEVEIPEDLVRPGVIRSVDDSLAEYNANPDNEDSQVTKRRQTVFEVEPDGIVLRLRLKVEVNNFFDPDVDVDAKIALGVSPEGQVLAFYRSFAVDVDWPWWVTGLTLGVTKIIEEFKDGTVERKLKNEILNDFRADIQARVDAFGTVGAIETVQDKVIVTVCEPSGGSLVGRIANPFDGVFVDIG